MQTCPGCGKESPDRFRLCGYCGSVLAVLAPSREVRKTVTVVLCNLKGSTELAGRLDSEALREMLTLYFSAMKSVLERHGGTIEKYIGDVIMAVFGLPRLHEDDALRAVRAAAEMRTALTELNAALRARYGVILENRTGIGTGEVVTGQGSPERLATGDAVNAAARLEQAAPPGGILIGESTYRLVQDAVEVVPTEPLELEDKPESVPAYQLISVTAYARSASPAGLPLVGRTRELAALDTEFRRSVAGPEGRLVTVLGEAGTGKSRLIEEFVRGIAGQGVVLRGRCLSYGDGITFFPLAEVLRQAAGIVPQDSEEDARIKLQGCFGEDLAEATRRIELVLGLSRHPYGQDELFWGVRAALEELARRGPLGHFTAVRDAVAGRSPSRELAAALACRATTLRPMGRTAEAVGDARRALALAREIGYPVGEVLALVELSLGADYAGDHDEAVRLARQAGQITAEIPGASARTCSAVLTTVLAGAGDLAEAQRVGVAGLARAQDAGDLFNQALLLPRIVDLDLRAGRTGDAAAHLREGLRLAVRTGNWYELLPCISQCGDLCAATGRAAEALTLWTACAAADQHQRHDFPHWFVPRGEEQQLQVRQMLGPGRARAAEDRGAAMSLATAAEYALMLTDPGPPQPAPGPGELSARERELVTLVARGRTNAQIAAELHISVRTVGSHLDRIRDKTSCRRRTDLTRLALSAHLV